MATGSESYFYTVPETDMPQLPDFDDHIRFGVLGRLYERATGNAPIDYPKLFESGVYATVMSLTVLREGEDGLEVLAGPRSMTNGTHVDVVSVPTGRKVPLMAAAAMNMCRIESRSSDEVMLWRHWYQFDSSEALEPHVIGGMAADTLSYKVGMADLVRLQPHGLSVSLESLTLGLSLVGADPQRRTKTIEAIAMMNAAVIVPPDTAAPNPPPAAYTTLKWFDLDSFQLGYRQRDAVGMFPEIAGEAVGMCVHGVCMATTSRVLQRGITLPAADDTEIIRHFPEGLQLAPYEYEI